MRANRLLLSLFMIWLFAGYASAQETTGAVFQSSECPFQNTSGYTIDCGMVSVPADHADPQGASIQLATAIIRSLNPDAAPDPVLYLAGGPGGAFVWTAPLMAGRYGLDVILRERDVILVDQRGMGLSQPRLVCPAYQSGADVFTLTPDEMAARVAACPAQLQAQGIDWRSFTTEQNAADLALVPAALGYETYNLYGTSYGTLLGLIILRDHAQGVRSAVLDSVLIPQASPFVDSAQVFADAFARLEAECQADIVCRTAYPDLRESLFQTYARLSEQPAVLIVGTMNISYTGEMFADQVLRALGERAAAQDVPAFIERSAQGDTGTALEFVQRVLAVPPVQLPDQALYMTMVCPQAVANTSLEQLEAAHSQVEGVFQVGGYDADDWHLCTAWGDLPAFDQRLPQSDIPTLLLSGELDPLTPPEWAQSAAENLSNAQLVSFPHTSHITVNDACSKGLLAVFLNDPAQPLDTTCTQQVSPLNFVLTASVTRPVVEVATAVSGSVALLLTGWALWWMLRHPRRVAWSAAFRRLGWFPLAAGVTIVLLVLSRGTILPQGVDQLGAVQAFVPLMMGLLSAAVFSPEDEPALEIQLAAERPLLWVIVERLVAVWLVMLLVGVIGSLVTLALYPDKDALYVLLAWIPAGVFLSGVGVYAAVRARMVVFGVIIAGLLWFAFSLFAEFFLPGGLYPFPLNVVQAFLWAIHLHATPADLAQAEFIVSRLFLLSSGVLLIALALVDLRDPERVLLQTSGKRRKAGKSAVAAHGSGMGLPQGAVIRVSWLAQIAAIARSEWLILWRGIALRVLLLTPLLGGGALLLIAGDLSSFFPTLSVTDEASRAIVNGEMMVMIGASFVYVLALYIYPLIVADRVPVDRHLHVYEMLSALPLPDAVYLAGKLCGALLATGAALVAGMAGMGIIAVLRLGAVDMTGYVELTVHLVIALAITVSLAVLAGSMVSTSRRALMVVILLLIVSEMLQVVPLVAEILPARAQYIFTSTFSSMENMAQLPLQINRFNLLEGEYFRLHLTGFVQVVIVALLALLRRRRS